MPKQDDLAVLIADLQRQRKELESNLDDTDRSRESTAQLVEKIIDLKQRSEAVLRGSNDRAHTQGKK